MALHFVIVIVGIANSLIAVYGLLQENGPELKWDDAKHICSKYVNKRSINFELILVYGHAGNELLTACMSITSCTSYLYPTEAIFQRHVRCDVSNITQYCVISTSR